MRLGRLLTMGIPELTVRGRQEAWKWLDRAAAGSRTIARPRRLPRTTGSALEPAPGRFFEGALSDATPTLLAERMPAARQRRTDQGVTIPTSRHSSRSFASAAIVFSRWRGFRVYASAITPAGML